MIKMLGLYMFSPKMSQKLVFWKGVLAKPNFSKIEPRLAMVIGKMWISFNEIGL